MADYPITGDRDEEEFRHDERVILAAQLMDAANRLPPLETPAGLPPAIRRLLRHERETRRRG